MEASELTRFNDFAKNKGQDPAKRRKKGADITLRHCTCFLMGILLKLSLASCLS